VWLTKDLRYKSYVALKIQKSAQHYVEAAYDEVEILDVIAKNIYNIQWLKDLEEYHKNNNESSGKVNGKFNSQHTQVV